MAQTLNLQNETNRKFNLPSALSLPAHYSLTASNVHKVFVWERDPVTIVSTTLLGAQTNWKESLCFKLE